MNDREALVAALKLIGGVSHQQALFLQPIIAAARERLAQLPEKCGTCGGDGIDRSTVFPGNCPFCHGSGKVYPAELVERIATVLYRRYPLEPVSMNRDAAVAVLDALNGETR